MSLDVIRDILQHLRSDVAVTQYLQTYNGQEAIFAIVPEDAPAAYVKIKQPYAMADASAKNGDKYSTEQFLDIIISYNREFQQYNPQSIDTTAEAVRKSLHRASITPQGSAQIEMAEAFGPIEADADNYFGRIVQCRLIVRETS